MKRLMITIVLLAVLLLPSWALAASSVTSDIGHAGDKVDVMTFDWTADTDGSVTSTASDDAARGYVFLVITDPGSPAPTDNYDITLTDSYGVDVVGGVLADRDTANSEQVAPSVGSVYGSRFVHGELTLNISNNSVNGAQGKVIIYIYKDE